VPILMPDMQVIEHLNARNFYQTVGRKVRRRGEYFMIHTE
jgi:hypothetical protein